MGDAIERDFVRKGSYELCWTADELLDIWYYRRWNQLQRLS